MVVQKLHPEFLTRLDRGGDAVCFVLANEVPDCNGDDHELERCDHPANVGSGHQCLAQDRNERLGQLNANLFLLIYRKLIDDTRYRPVGGGRVQRSEDQVPRLGGPQSCLHCLQVAKLSDQDHVRILAQHAAQGLGKAGHVHPHFALIDHGFLVVVVVFDRLFDRNYVPIETRVDIVDHRRQRGGLPAPRGPGNQKHPSGAAA